MHKLTYLDVNNFFELCLKKQVSYMLFNMKCVNLSTCLFVSLILLLRF